MYLAFGIAAREAGEVAHIFLIHSDDDVIGVLVGACHERRTAFLVWDGVCVQHGTRAMVGGAADFIRMECLGGDTDAIRQSRLANEMFHHELRHRRAADVAVADK